MLLHLLKNDNLVVVVVVYQACLLVYDVSNKLSFDVLDHWLQEFVPNTGKNCIVAVVANKVRKQTTFPDNHGILFFIIWLT